MFARQKRKILRLCRIILIGLLLPVVPKMAVCRPIAPEAKILKIGVVINDTWPGGVDFKKHLDVVVPLFSESGGLVINGNECCQKEG